MAAASLPATADGQQEPSRRIPVVTSRFLPEARALLADSAGQRGRVDSVPPGIDRAAPALGGSAVVGAADALLRARFGSHLERVGVPYVRELAEALSTPLPRVLIAGWRSYEEFLPFTAAEGRPASSGQVDLVDQETQGRWEIALTLGLEAGTVRVTRGRITGLRAVRAGGLPETVGRKPRVPGSGVRPGPGSLRKGE